MDERDLKAMNEKLNETPQLGVFGVVARFFYNIEQVTLIRFEYNTWNGIIFTILGICYQGDNKGFEADFIGIHKYSNGLLVYVLFIRFEIKWPFLK